MDDEGPDAEFRQVFVEEARERLEVMSGLLLQLESADDEPEAIAALFREAHTLKGGAAMVGFTAVARLAHALEDLLTQLREGTRALTPMLVDALLAGVDALGSAISSAVAGVPHEPAAEAAERGAPRRGRPARP